MLCISLKSESAPPSNRAKSKGIPEYTEVLSDTRKGGSKSDANKEDGSLSMNNDKDGPEA